ncbi:putative glucans biosynthesis protein D [Pseudodesulfovibrio sediminis]|uniref:Glucans biosynthesis protein D n=2 Tax=Pseudodesulfovibrio sediminis TaxID=2810563 RepID=A0ABM7P588_9BACT|nr:putative glucans biosynthesis protein D [Pseudodesulfovibrio sediminis]
MPVRHIRGISLRQLTACAVFALAIAGMMMLPTLSSDHETWLPGPQAAHAATAPQEPFDYAILKGKARTLAQQPYIDHKADIPKAVKDMTWDQYQSIHFNNDHALWRKKDSRFRGTLFHLGLYFTQPVAFYELNNGLAKRIDYDPGLFKYGKSHIDPEKLPADLGFAGFRLQFKPDWVRDVVAFLGASYFRAVGKEMQYGLSARGLAVDTALPRPEEFPMFTAFWMEQPKPGSNTATVYALLDSPSITGAYRFDITPGDTLTMRVDAALYPRKAIERLGIAPLTSMFMVGENDRRMGYDWRPEIHDSDGLAMHTGSGEWIWRPLNNPRTLRFNAYTDENPKAFGLLQRDQNFDHYQDDGVYYDKRPGLWVMPRGNWGKGSVQLVEIPTLDETFDNIVAFWSPDKPIEPGQELLYSYDLFWGTAAHGPKQLAHVADTFTGLGGAVGKRRAHFSKRFVVDFTGGKLSRIGDDARVSASIITTAGTIEMTRIEPLHSRKGYRVRFDLVPPDTSENPINLRLFLKSGKQTLSETWVYQWTPPPADQRQLHNAGHLH